MAAQSVQRPFVGTKHLPSTAFNNVGLRRLIPPPLPPCRMVLLRNKKTPEKSSNKKASNRRNAAEILANKVTCRSNKRALMISELGWRGYIPVYLATNCLHACKYVCKSPGRFETRLLPLQPFLLLLPSLNYPS